MDSTYKLINITFALTSPINPAIAGGRSFKDFAT